MLNQLLGGRYKIIRALGEGGLAQTYIAEDYHKPSHPRCTVKFLKPASKEADFLPIARRLFDKEAEILEKLGEHPQIPRLLAHFEEDKEFYIIQEFIDGYTLSTELPLGHCWSESKVISMLQDVLQILEFVHSYGVIHRDIKPNNLIRRKIDSRLVLIDFGAVKEVSNLRIVSNMPTSKKTIAIGTQGYMPTEQVRGKPRLNSDIYALGMVGIQALTGVDPIYLEEDYEGEVIWRNRVTVSNLLADILTNMVRYHFKDRSQSATEVLKALEPLTNDCQYTQTVVVTKQINSELSSESEFKETKKTKVAFKPESLISQTTSELELKETKELKDISPWNPWNEKEVVKKELEKKIAPDTKKPNLELASEPELQETRISLNTEQLKEKVPTQALSQETKITINSQDFSTSSLEIASERQKNSFFTVFRDLKVSFTPTLFAPKKFSLLIGAGTISILLGLFASYHYFNQRKAYLQAEETLKQIEELKVAEKYSECIEQARIFPQDYTNLNSKVNNLLMDCQQGEAQEKIASAKKLAEQSKYQNAIAIIAQIPPDLAVYAEAQSLISQWSAKIFQIATNNYREGKLEVAKEIAVTIPATSSLAKKVQTTIRQWDEEWKQNQTYLETAQKGINERRWQEAINAAQKISKHSYWQKQSQQIIQKAEREIRAARSIAAKKANNFHPKTVYRSPSTTTYPKPISRSLPLLSLPRPNPSQPASSASEPPSEWICLNNPNPKCQK